MTRIQRSALLSYSTSQMFDLVEDVLSYPSFLPWCSRATLLEKKDDELVARLELSKGPVQQSFVTRNRLQRPNSMTLELVEGPFSKLSGGWRFVELPQGGCKIELSLEFEIKGRLLNMTLKPLFKQATDKMVDAFTQRAKQLYG